MTETDLMRRIMRRFSKATIRLFRNSVGGAWHATPDNTFVRKVPGTGPTVTLKNARFIKYGLAEGSHDLIGFREIVIMPWHVGKTIAQFISFETKSLKGKPTIPQLAFLHTVKKAGGLAAIVKTEQEAEAELASGVGQNVSTNAAGTTRQSQANPRRRMAGTMPSPSGQNAELKNS